jgi:tight adherence protein B
VFYFSYCYLFVPYLSYITEKNISANNISLLIKKPPQTTTSFGRKIPLLKKFQKTYAWADLPFAYDFFLMTVLIVFLLNIFIGYVFGLFFWGLLSGIFFSYIYILTIRVLAQKNYHKISRQLPFVLETLSGSVQAGFSLEQALRFTTDEIDKPFQSIFQKILTDINYNIPLEDAFLKAKGEIPNQEFQMVMDSLVMQSQMGGNIVQMLQQMADWIRQKNKLEKDMKVFTSQGRLSGIIIALLWPLSATIFYFLNADYISILFTNSLGQFFLFLSIILETIGFLMIWKIIKIRI